MLLVVLVLVLAAFGLLVTALTSATTAWAWGSVAASALAAAVLVADWLRRKRRRGAVDADPPLTAYLDLADADFGEPGTKAEPDTGVEPVEAEPTVAEHVPATAEAADQDEDDLDPDVEPAEEDTDAADLLTVTDLDVPVVVLDERPRYHLATCRWLGDRPTLDLPVQEARQLGFTPCAVCTPDRVLAAKQRSAGRAPAN